MYASISYSADFIDIVKKVLQNDIMGLKAKVCNI